MAPNATAVEHAASRKDRSPLLPVVVGAVFGVLATCLLVGVLLLGVVGGLPSDLRALSSWSSPEPSYLLDAEGVVRARFRLVDAAEWPGSERTELIDAFLAAAPSTFYEPRSARATSLGPALRRVLARVEPRASPLSVGLARDLLADEAPGFARSLRTDLLASWLDAGTTLSERLVAYLDRVPLCLGRRGLRRAARLCFDEELETLDGGELATLAVAAAHRLDLAGDRDVLEARRDATLDALVQRRRMEPSAASEFAARPHRAPRPSGDSAWEELAALGVRQALGEGRRAGGVTVHTGLDWALAEALRRALPAATSFLAVAPASGAVLAAGGDVLGTLPDAPELRAVDLAAWLAAVVRSASVAGRPADEIPKARLRWTIGIDTGVPGEDVEASDALGALAGAALLRQPAALVLGAATLAALPLDGRVRRVSIHGATALLHEDLVVVVVGDCPAATALLGDRVGGAAFTAPERFAWTAAPPPGP